MNSSNHTGSKQCLLGLALAMSLSTLSARAGSPQNTIKVQGGGIALFDASVPFDSNPNDIDGSGFGFNVVIGGDGSVNGECRYVMAGRTDFEPNGPQVMMGNVTDASVNLDGTVTLYSTGLLHNWKGEVFDAEVQLTVTAGGAGVGTIQATFTIPGWGLDHVLFPVQTLVSGQVKIR